MTWPNRSSAPFALNVQLSADDYRRYFAVAGKRQSNWSNVAIFVIALFAAILVAFAFRAVATLETTDPVAIELIGSYSLFAYAFGVLVFLLVGAIVRRRSIAGLLAGTLNAFEPKTVVIAEDGISITGKLSHVTYSWPAIGQLTVTQGLLFLWIGSQSAGIIPERTFATEEMRKSAIAFIEGKIAAAKQSA